MRPALVLRSAFALSISLLATALLWPRAATAQEPLTGLVYGTLIDDATRGPIVGGAVTILNSRGTPIVTVLTDSLGRFRLAARIADEYRLRAERIGYKTAESPNFHLQPGDVVPMDFWLSTNAVLLAPLEVKVSPREWVDRSKYPGIAPFYERMRWYGKLGSGVFLTREQVREWDSGTVSSMLLATAGAKPTSNGGVTLRMNCAPTYYLNGHPFPLPPGETIDRLFRPADLEAVEVYKGASSLPAEFGGTLGSCAVVLWTRRT